MSINKILLKHSCAHSYAYSLCLLSATTAQMNNYNINTMVLKACNIYYLVLYRRSLQTYAPDYECPQVPLKNTQKSSLQETSIILGFKGK